MENIIKALRNGTKLHGEHGEYVIDTVLGTGSFGITYRAKCKVKVEHVTHTVNYAIKEFFISSMCSREEDGTIVVNEAQKANYERHRKAFVKEARMLYDLPPHEGIVKVNEVFDAYNTTYYVMEYLDESLTEQVKSSADGKLSERQALDIFVKVASAVRSLHEHSRLHLDIKPDNIMMNDREPKLIDFGQSRVFDEYGNLINTDSDSVCSDGYSPVEQYAGINRFMPSADVYALGATLLFMLTGERPAVAKDMDIALVESKLPENVSEDTRRMLHGALAKDSNARFKSVAEMLSVIGVIVNTGDGSETKLIGGSSERKITVPWRALKIAAGVVFAIVCAIVLLNVLKGCETHDAEQKTVSPVADSDTIVKLDAPMEVEPAALEDKSGERIEKSDEVVKKDEGRKDEVEVRNAAPSPALDYATWTGRIANGKPEGRGKMVFTKSHVIPGTSITANAGDVIDDGSFYDGKFTRGTINGKYIEIEE